MKDLFGYELIRTLGLWQPFASLMLHGKIESRKVMKGKAPGFPCGKYLLYSTKEEYALEDLKYMCGDEILETIYNTLADEPTAQLRGYALVLADLVKVRKMTAADERSAYVKYRPSLETETWLLDFRNVQRIEPFVFEHGKQGIGFLDESEKSKIKYYDQLGESIQGFRSQF